MSQKEPFFSVILPVKNGDLPLLTRALSSVTDQSYSHFEVILVDDGSEEDYGKALDQLIKGDCRFHLFHIAASGVSYARNYGIMQAKGDIITFLDSDDVLNPFCFQEALSVFESTDADALWGGTFFGKTPEINKTLKKQTEKGPLPKETLLSRLINLTSDRIHLSRAECTGEPFRFENLGYISRGIAAKFIRKECFSNTKILFPIDIKMYEDVIWNLNMVNELRVIYVKSIWYYYYDNSVSTSNAFHSDAVSRMEIPIQIIRSILDLSDPVEYASYTKLLMDSLRYVFKGLYGNPKWNASGKERSELKNHLYHDNPWKEIGTDQFRSAANKRDRQKAVLFRCHLLFIYWKLAWNRM